jgi:hypothetical protein
VYWWRRKTGQRPCPSSRKKNEAGKARVLLGLGYKQRRDSTGGRGRLDFYFPKHCLFDSKTGLKTNLKTKPDKNLISN